MSEEIVVPVEEVEVPVEETEAVEVSLTTANRVTFPITPEVQAFIDAEQIIVEDCDVDIGLGGKSEKNKIIVTYNKLTALTLEAMIAMAEGVSDLVMEKDEKTGEVKPARGKPSVTSYANYGYDLNRKRDVRQDYLSANEGPEKAIKQAVAALVRLGVPEEQALAIAKASPKAAAAAA